MQDKNSPKLIAHNPRLILSFVPIIILILSLIFVVKAFDASVMEGVLRVEGETLKSVMITTPTIISKYHQEILPSPLDGNFVGLVPIPRFQVKILDERITEDMLKPERPMSAAFDLRACIDKKVELAPGQAMLIPTGLAIFIADPCIAGCIVPRSGAGHKRGLVLGNGTGLIDGDYQGQWMVSACNRNEEKYVEIEPMERIAQAYFVPVFHPNFKFVKEFTTETERGEGGFGSTGK